MGKDYCPRVQKAQFRITCVAQKRGRTQQLPALLGQQWWELLRPCWQKYANGCNYSQQCWSFYVKINLARHQQDTQSGIVAVDSFFAILRYGFRAGTKAIVYSVNMARPQAPCKPADATLLDTLLHVVACCWQLLPKVWNRSNFWANKIPKCLLFRDRQRLGA